MISSANNNNYAYFMLSGMHLSITNDQSRIYRISHSGMYIWATMKRTAYLAHPHSRMGPNRFETLFR